MDTQYDVVNRPKHYASHPSGVECIELTRLMPFALGNAVKYIVRHKEKSSPVQDLEKALWYVTYDISQRENEGWAMLPGIDGYEVSTLGNVRRVGSRQNRKLVRLKNGYLTFSAKVGGKMKLSYVHRAVIEAFIGRIEKGMCVRHLNGCREDNHIENLRIGTYAENSADTKAHGRCNSGCRNGHSKITQDTVDAIRAERGSSVSVAHKYGVSKAVVYRIRSGGAYAEDTESPYFRNRAVWTKFLAHEPDANVRVALRALFDAHFSGSPVRMLRECVDAIKTLIAEARPLMREGYRPVAVWLVTRVDVHDDEHATVTVESASPGEAVSVRLRDKATCDNAASLLLTIVVTDGGEPTPDAVLASIRKRIGKGGGHVVA